MKALSKSVCRTSQMLLFSNCKIYICARLLYSPCWSALRISKSVFREPACRLSLCIKKLILIILEIKKYVLDTLGFCLNSSIINYCFSRAFWLFEAYHCSEDDLCEIYALQDIKLGSDSFLAKFHDTKLTLI